MKLVISNEDELVALFREKLRAEAVRVTLPFVDGPNELMVLTVTHHKVECRVVIEQFNDHRHAVSA